MSGNPNLFQGPRPFRFESLSVWCRDLLGRVCVSWYIELFAGGGKAATIENGNRNATVWKFQLFHGSRPFRFGSWSVWCRHLLWRVRVYRYIALFGGGGKAAPIENGNRNSTGWEFQLFQGHRPHRLGTWSVWCTDLLGRFFAPGILHYRGRAKRGPCRERKMERYYPSYRRGAAPLGFRRAPFGVGVY